MRHGFHSALPIALLLGCPADEDGAGETGAAGTATTTDATMATTTPSTSSTDPGSSVGSESSATTTPVLDVGSTEGDMSRGPYEPCIDDSQCMEGFTCRAIGAGMGSPTSHCTTTCSDPAECPEHSTHDVGCLQGPLMDGMQCAILCSDGECPDDLTCWNPGLDGAPCAPA
jgi:hypothetical protein